MLDHIRKLGLNEYEAKAYDCLIRKGSLPAVSVSRSAGIPRARVYDVLASLESKGFVLRSASRQADFSAVNPSKAFRALAERKKKELDETLKELESVAGLLEKNAGSSEGFGEESAWLCRGRQNIYAQMAEQAKNCSESVFICSSPEGVKRKKAYLSGQNSLFQLSKQVKIASKVTAPSVPGYASPAASGEPQNAVLRQSQKNNSPKNASRFVVFDKDSVLLFLTPEKTDEKDEKALLIKSPFLANFFYSSARK